MVCCTFTLMTTCFSFATIVKNTGLIRYWNGPDLSLHGRGFIRDKDLLFRLKL